MPDDNNNSFLKSAAAASPFAVGLGIGIKNILNETNLNPKPSAIENMRNAAAQVKTNQVDVDTHIRFMNNQFAGGQNANMAVAAWEAAIERVDPITRKQLLTFTSDISNMSDTDAVNAIRNTMKNNRSILMRNLYSKFRRNVETLSTQQQLFPNLPFAFTTPSVEEIPYRPKMIPENLQPRLKSIASRLGLSVSPMAPARSLDVYDVFKINLAGMPGGDISLTLPITNEGLMVEGMTMQTQRIAPKIGLVSGGEVTKMSREEFFLKEFEESILPDIESGRLKGRSQIKEAVDQLSDKMFRELEAATYLSDEDKTAAQIIREGRRANMLQLVKARTRTTEGKTGYVAGYEPLQGLEYQKAMVRHGYFGGISPTAVAKGIVSTEDLSQYNLTPEATNWGRRPESAYREWQLTEDSIGRLKELQGSRYNRYQMLQADQYRSLLTTHRSGDPINPIMTTTYIDPEKHGGLLERLHMRDGHAMMTQEGLDALEFESTHAFKLKSIRSDLESQLGDTPFDVQKGEALGIDTEGNIVTAEDDMSIKMRRNMSDAEGDFVTVLSRRKWQARHGDKFHEMLKATMLRANQNQVRMAGRETNAARLFENTQVIASMEDLKKNTQLYRNQIITSLGEDMTKNRDIKKLMKFVATTSAEAGLDDAAFTEKMMSYAMEDLAVEPSAFGKAFGASSYVLGAEKAEGIMDKVLGATQRPEAWTFKKAAMEGVSRGGAKLAFDKPPSMLGAGKALGSVEPRIFEDFRLSHWGPLGAGLADEFTERLISTDPDKLAVHQGVGKTLESITQGVSRPAGASVFEAADFEARGGRRGFQEWTENLGTEGGYISQGKGMNDVYVPSPSVVNKMRRYTTPAGKKTSGALNEIYENIARNAYEMNLDVDALDPKEAAKNLERYRSELAYHWAPGGKGLGGFERGKIAGSRYLRAMAANKRGQASDDLRVARMSNTTFDNMMQELVEQQGDNAELAMMRERFAAGETIGGVIQRHPDIGPFSTQQILYQRDSSLSNDQIVMPEKTLDLELEGGAKRSIKVGPTVGMAQDFDADQVAAFLVSPKHEEQIRKNLMQSNNEYTQAYMQHQIRYQLLKPQGGKQAGAISIAEKMAADVQKLGTTQTWVPQLSLEMTKAKTALGQFGKGQAGADASMFLEWLEQHPISAKKLTAKDISQNKLEDLMNRIQYSMRNRDVKGLTNVVMDITEGDEVARDFLFKDVSLTQESARNASQMYGTNVPTRIAAPKVESAIGEMFRSLDEFRSSGAEAEFDLLAGRARRPKADTINGLLKSTKGVFSTVSTAVQTASNIAGSLGRSLIKNKKPIGWGFAGALAISSFLSSPRDTIGPGNNLNMGLKPNFSPGKGADRMSPENVMPPSQHVGQPSVPNMLHQNSVRIGSNTPSHRVHVKANVGSGTNASQMAQQVANMTNRSTSINIRDDRQSLNPHRIANKM